MRGAAVHPPALLVLAILVSTLGLLGCPRQDPARELPADEAAEFDRAQQEATQACEGRDPCVIVIGFDQDRLTYRERESGENAEVTRIWRQQRVEWEFEGAEEWAIEFLRGRSPLPAARYGTRQGLERGGPVEARRGLFKYFVAAVRDGQLYTDDPEFIIH